MTAEEARTLVDLAIDQLLRTDSLLLEINANERSLSHQLAVYISLSPLIKPPISVDCEYNRQGVNVKKLRMQLEVRSTSDDDLHATTVFPDIVVHERNSDLQNLIVLELKKSKENLVYDRKKLIAFKQQLKYQHAAHVILKKDSTGQNWSEVIWIDDQAVADAQPLS
jgi:hypothetical protein